jgi:hypothetical protein
MLHLRLIILSVVGDIIVNSETLLLTDFINFKIKPVQFFEDVHKGSMCVYVHRVSDYMCINIYVYTMFLKKELYINIIFIIISFVYISVTW